MWAADRETIPEEDTKVREEERYTETVTIRPEWRRERTKTSAIGLGLLRDNEELCCPRCSGWESLGTPEHGETVRCAKCGLYVTIAGNAYKCSEEEPLDPARVR